MSLFSHLVGVGVFGSGRGKGYRPVVIVHGIFDGPKQFRTLSRFIKEVNIMELQNKKKCDLDHIDRFGNSNFVVSFFLFFLSLCPLT